MDHTTTQGRFLSRRTHLRTRSQMGSTHSGPSAMVSFQRLARTASLSSR